MAKPNETFHAARARIQKSNEARVFINRMKHANGSLRLFNMEALRDEPREVCFDPKDTRALLQGRFTVHQLRALADYMESTQFRERGAQP